MGSNVTISRALNNFSFFIKYFLYFAKCWLDKGNREVLNVI